MGLTIQLEHLVLNNNNTEHYHKQELPLKSCLNVSELAVNILMYMGTSFRMHVALLRNISD